MIKQNQMLEIKEIQKSEHTIIMMQNVFVKIRYTCDIDPTWF